MSALDIPIGTSGRQTQGVTPVYRPMINGESLDITVSKLEVALADFQHDVATMACTSSTLTDTQALIGSAFSFFFGLSPNTVLFTGYIDSIKEEQSSSGGGVMTFTIGCLGATKEMQNGKPRFWSNNTIPQVVERLATHGLLGFHSHVHPLVWPCLAQTEETDWRIAANLARRLGWSLFNRDGVLMLYNPLQLFKESGSFIQLVASQYASTAFEDYERALVEFVPIEESNVSYRQMGFKVSYFNGNVVQTVTQQGENYEAFKHLTHVEVRSPEEADVYANALTFAAANWKQQAMARVLGNANLYPGMCVDIYTSNPKYYRDRYNGRWLIRGVQHSADRQTFQTQLALCRPDSTTGISMLPYVPFWNQYSSVPSNGHTVLVKTRPTMDLHEGRWRSSWANVYSISLDA